MTGFLNSVMNFLYSENIAVRMLVTLAILVTGHLLAKISARLTRYTWKRTAEDQTKKDVERRESRIQGFSYTVDALTIAAALFYLNTPFTSQLYTDFVETLPELFSVGLIGILGVIVINMAVDAGKGFFNKMGVRSYFREVGLSSQAFGALTTIIKGFLYLVLLKIMLNQLGVGETFVNPLITASSWAAAFLGAALIFYSFKDLFQNFAAGIYLKSSQMVRPGKEVRLNEETGEIRNVNLFSTSVDTNSGYTLMAPNNEIMKSPLKFKRSKSDLETLEDVTGYFVAQNPSYCGPASMEMALEAFGYRHDQDEIGEKANTVTEDPGEEETMGTEPEDLIEAVEELTNNDVKAAWIEYDKINDLGDELKAWFNDGALALPNFYKPEIFPDATTGHYVLAVGVEGDEILIMDPSTSTGGAYFVDKDRLKTAMSEFDHKRGYLVVAPKGTTAYWRIKKDLIYSDENYYDQLSKTLESRLRKILRQGRLLKNVVSDSMEDYIEEWRSEEKVTRVWSPEVEDDRR
ncbi:MAG: C39 family peptidase [Candidatus Nanohaloarchaea archaeon]